MTIDTTPHAAHRPITAIRLTGGRVCLDFVNTVDDRVAPTAEDYIATPARYLEWAVHAGAIDAAEQARAAAPATDGAALMRDVHALREALYAVFVARAEGKPAPAAAIACLDIWVHRAWGGLALGRDGRLAWNEDAIDAWLPLKRIALSALDLLQEPDAGRLKLCAATGNCGWLFLDTSKNNSRRWCAMETCGTTHKMARYRDKAR